MLRMGLTGGIGAGKSTVAKELVELGAVIVDSDVVAREIVAPGSEGLAELVDAFGEDILQPDGTLDRPALAAKAFASEDARAVLNAITHPRVGRRTAELVAAAPDDAVVVQDIPLLVEGGMAPAFHLVAVVHADEAERIRRLVELRGMPEADARARIAAQATEEQRREVADVWLDNTGDQQVLVEQVRTLWNDRLVPFEKNLRTGVVVEADPVLVPAREEWHRQAQRLVARLALAAGGAAKRIDHVGSTAVPGLAGVDVIDLQITVGDLAAADALAPALAAAGFPRIDHVVTDDPKPSYGAGGETDPAVWEMRLHGSADPGRPARVAVRVDGWPAQQFALLLRDWLSAVDTAKREYADLKADAAVGASQNTDRAEAAATYAALKAPWFDRAHHRAWEWAESTGWSA
ncbi:dephospho-CoA kinase [Rhodococcus pyridinivorans]|uniref:Dephospho-CoA kinase n=1 Tax=Rhodococcus pyridinivorans TaxID=103816 RepID=A0A7M2XGT1_9NOCA|nr:dephospho-CoA kinase [Rhodococcus pyridinivorans]QOV96938.1 dephospho-CoA kinase [Rhodococcus pyridinivorans]WMM70902.1 dephospho-CoA kinase [Rhodococcus pyridinivorans]